MNKSFWIVVLCLCTLTLGADNSVKLGWCPSPSVSVAGYKLCYSIGIPTNWAPEIKVHSLTNPCDTGITISSGSNWLRNYTNFIDVGNTLAYTVTNLEAGKIYFFSIMAYSSFGDEAPFSNEVMYQVPDSAPPMVRGLTVKRY